MLDMAIYSLLVFSDIIFLVGLFLMGRKIDELEERFNYITSNVTGYSYVYVPSSGVSGYSGMWGITSTTISTTPPAIPTNIATEEQRDWDD